MEESLEKSKNVYRIGSWVYPMGSIVITLVHLSDSRSVSPCFSSETFHEVGGQESKESDKARI